MGGRLRRRGELGGELAEDEVLARSLDQAEGGDVPEGSWCRRCRGRPRSRRGARTARPARSAAGRPRCARPAGGGWCRGRCRRTLARAFTCSGRTLDGPDPNRPSEGSRLVRDRDVGGFGHVWNHGIRGPEPLHDRPIQDLPPHAAVSPSATLAVDARRQGAPGGGRARHRLRRRRAGLPHPGGTSSKRPRPPAPTRCCTTTRRRPGSRPCGPPSPPRRVRDSGFAVEPSQVLVTNGAKQAVANAFAVPARPGRRGPRPRPLLDDLPRGDRPRRRGPGRGALGRVDRLPGPGTDLEAATTERTKVLLFVSPSNPTGAVYPRAEIAGDRARGPLDRGLVGGHRRDLRAPRLRRGRAPLDAGPRPRARRHLRRHQRGGQDLPP